MPDLIPHILLTQLPLDESLALAQVRNINAGAVVLFLGTVREMTGTQQTVYLEYEAYEELAIIQLQELCKLAAAKWPIQAVAIHHRLGKLDLGDIAVIVAVSTPHRQEAFESAQFLMHKIKEVVPIWKKERWADGSSSWIHPDTPLISNQQEGT